MKLLKSVWVASLPSANNELQQLLSKYKNFSLWFLFPILGLSKSVHYDWKLFISPSFPVNYTSKFRRGKKWKEKIKGPRFPAQHVAFGVDLRSEKNISLRSSNCPRYTSPEIPAEGSWWGEREQGMCNIVHVMEVVYKSVQLVPNTSISPYLNTVVSIKALSGERSQSLHLASVIRTLSPRIT